MECERIKQYLSAYVDNELSEAERKQTEEHLASCSKCSQEIATLKKVANLVSSLPKVSAPYGLAQRVQRQLLKPQPSTEAPWVRFLFRYRWALGGVVTTAAALMIVYINIILLSKPATVTELERPPKPESVVAPITPPSDKVGMETGDTKVLEKDTSPDALARNKAGADRLTNATSGRSKTGLHLKHSGEESLKATPKKGVSGFIGKGKKGMATDGLEHKKRKQQTIEPTLARKQELSKLMTQTEGRKEPSLLSQKVLVACADLDTQVSELEKIVKNTLSQNPKAQIIEVTGNTISMLDVPTDKQIQSQITQLRNNINSFRQQQRNQANAPLQIKVSIPLEQKEHLIAQLDRLGQVQVSQLRASQPGDLSAGKLDDLALNLQDQINKLTKNAEELDRRSYAKRAPAPAQAASGKLAKAPGLLDKEPQTKQRDKNEQALTQIESDTIRLYDLKLQRAVQQKQHTRKKESWNQETNKGKKDMDHADSSPASPALESEGTRGAGQILEEQKGFTLGRPSQTIMIELVITLKEKE